MGTKKKPSRCSMKMSQVIARSLALYFTLPFVHSCCTLNCKSPASTQKLESIVLSNDGARFQLQKSGAPFIVWGVNYDHDRDGRLIEDYWVDDWQTVVDDFHEIKSLGANVVRIHLQTTKIMKTPDKPDPAALNQLQRLVQLAEQTGLYLNITGLGCYHKQDLPDWFTSMDEKNRWKVQAYFWEAVSKTCADSPAIFCYDLMNEPIAPGKTPEMEWLGGEFGGKFFTQRIALELNGRTSKQVARAWIENLVIAIRRYDKRHLVTLGVIPWAFVWPNANPLFYSQEVSGDLDFVSVHFYPKKGEIVQALKALKAYDIGKPLVIEEMFPLACSIDELTEFVEKSKPICEGWTSFYWGKTIEEYAADQSNVLTQKWLERFRIMSTEL